VTPVTTGGRVWQAALGDVRRDNGESDVDRAQRWDKRPPDADYVILADPEGNPFCVADTAPQ
jgi:hypothetical protein